MIEEERLRAKGWSEKDIAHAQTILKQQYEENEKKEIFYEHVILYFSILLVLLATVVGSWMFIPLLIIMTPTVQIITLIVVGIAVGSFVGYGIRTNRYLQEHHHGLIMFLLPILTIVATIFIGGEIHFVHEAIEQTTRLLSPLVLATIYGFSTIGSYVLVLRGRK